MRRRWSITLASVSALALALGLVLLSQPTRYWVAFTELRLGMDQREVERLLPAGESDEMVGEEAWIAWEGLQDGEKKTYAGPPSKFEGHTHSVLFHTRLWRLPPRDDERTVLGRICLTDKAGRLTWTACMRPTEFLAVAFDENGQVVEKLYTRTRHGSPWARAREWLSNHRWF